MKESRTERILIAVLGSSNIPSFSDHNLPREIMSLVRALEDLMDKYSGLNASSDSSHAHVFSQFDSDRVCMSRSIFISVLLKALRRMDQQDGFWRQLKPESLVTPLVIQMDQVVNE